VPAGTRGLLRKSTRRKPHSSIQVTPNTRPSLRSGLTAYAALSPATSSFLSPSPCELAMAETRLSPDPSPQGLTVATTARTTRFCRTQLIRLRPRASPDFGAGRPHGVRTSRGSSRPGPAFPCPALPRPPHPDPRSTRRTIAPLLGPGWRDNVANPNFGKVEYFCWGGLTRFWCFARRVKWAQAMSSLILNGHSRETLHVKWRGSSNVPFALGSKSSTAITALGLSGRRSPDGASA